MMKKLWLISALSLGLLLLAGCNNSSSVTINSSDDLISLYNSKNAITCNVDFSVEDAQATSTLYAKDWVIAVNIKSIVDWNVGAESYLMKDDKIYAWGDYYWDGIGLYNTYEFDFIEELKWFVPTDENTVLKCSKWIKDNSVFNLPSNIQFASVDEYVDYEEDEYNNEYDEEYVNEDALVVSEEDGDIEGNGDTLEVNE